MKNKNYCHDVAAVLVTYNPKWDGLRATLQAIQNQVPHIFIVDNASTSFSFECLEKLEVSVNVKLHLLQQKENIGIGAAHNIGIRRAIEFGAKFVLLLDQDSQASQDMVVKLRSAYSSLNEAGSMIAALGPQYCDVENHMLSGFGKVGLFHFVICRCNNNTPTIDADFLISSGSLLPVDALEIVGLMDESLFIDQVDTEWCFRAKSKGLHLYGVCGALMIHALGERRQRLWFLRTRTMSFHKPSRYYYMFRNSILLFSRNYMPLRWKIADSAKCLKILGFLCLFAEIRLEVVKMIWLGVIDGLKGKSGKRDDL